MTAAAAAPRRRVRAEVRRELLLDAAAELLAEHGGEAVTMEAVAARAGVNKAIPYRHFGNAEDLLVQLYVRFSRLLARAVLDAIESKEDVEGRVAGVVHAYFDVVSRHRALLSIALAPASKVARDAGRELDAATFVPDLLVEHFDVPPNEAAATADLALGVLSTATQSWARRSASRRRLEALATAALLGVIRTARA